MSQVAEEVQRPLEDSNAVFHYFPELAAEIRREIWDLASPGIIDVYCGRDSIRHVKLHPFLSACPESRDFYLRGATYPEPTSRSQDAELEKIPFHPDRDYFRLHLPQTGSFSYDVKRLLEHTRKIIVPPDSFKQARWLMLEYFKEVEIRVCIADLPNHLILSPPSAFRRACPVDLCIRHSDKYYKTYKGYLNDERFLEFDGRLMKRQSRPLWEPCPSCRWARQLHLAGICPLIFSRLETWDLMLDKDLPHRPPVEDIKKARLPMLVFSFCREEEEDLSDDELMEIYERVRASLDEPEEIDWDLCQKNPDCVTGTCTH